MKCEEYGKCNMWPDEEIQRGTIYMEIGDLKVELLQIPSVRLEVDKKASKRKTLELKAWRKKIWTICDNDAWYLFDRNFEKRNAAIMWLKRYGKENTTYRLERLRGVHALVRVVNGYVYFYNPDYGLMISAESKRTCNYATRNN